MDEDDEADDADLLFPFRWVFAFGLAVALGLATVGPSAALTRAYAANASAATLAMVGAADAPAAEEEEEEEEAEDDEEEEDDDEEEEEEEGASWVGGYPPPNPPSKPLFGRALMVISGGEGVN